MKKSMLLTLSAAAITACTFFEPNPILPVGADYSIIDGDTVKTRVEKDFKQFKKNDLAVKYTIFVGDTVVTYKAPKLHTPPSKLPDLSKLKNNEDPELKGKPLRMVAIGGSLTAGVLDGGYFNEGMATSYPNLIARQMGIKFEQPYFDADSYNGYGRKVRTNYNPTGGPVPKFKEVSNNSGVEQVFETIEQNSNFGFKLKKIKTPKNIDNYAIPFANDIEISPNMGAGNPFSQRFDNKDNLTGKQKNPNVFERKMDFIIIESKRSGGLEIHLGMQATKVGAYFNRKYTDDIISTLDSRKGIVPYGAYQEFVPQSFLIAAEAKRLKIKGVILNQPNIYQLPFFQSIIKDSDVKKIFRMVGQDPIEGGKTLFIPNSTTDSLVSDKVNINLKPGIGRHKSRLLNEYFVREDDYLNNYLNEYKRRVDDINYTSKVTGLPVVDIYSLYDKIIKGTFITDDGIRVDASYPNGNFFSSDGFSPTAFGQAVIANEVIKVLNSTYKTEIPLIRTAEYLPQNLQ